MKTKPKRILLVNNYNMEKARELFLKDKSPSHHLFGINELFNDKNYTIDCFLVSPKNRKSRISKLLSLIPLWIKLYFKSYKYDVIYGAADFTIDFLGFMKKNNLFTPKLIAIFHHPPFYFRIKHTKYDSLIFLSQSAYEEMQKTFPSLALDMFFMQWGPDVDFYDKNIQIPNYKKELTERLTFISNGKTKRDHETFVNAIEDLQTPGIIVSDIQNIPRNYSIEKCLFTKIHIQETPNDQTMVKLLNESSVLVIPTYPSEKMLGPIGLTSFLDAIALGMPIITANKTVFSKIVEIEKMGIVYKAGNLADLKAAMNIFINDKSLIRTYGENAYQYGRKNDINKFSAELKKLLDN